MNDKKITFRRANIEDTGILFQWKNDATAIANSLTGRGVTMKEHETWLQSVLANENRLLYIMEMDEQPAGQLRLDLSGEEGTDGVLAAEISYGLEEKYRGQGLGAELLLYAEKIAKEKGIKELKAEVLPHNTASLHLFRKLGYQEMGEDIIVFFKKL